MNKTSQASPQSAQRFQEIHDKLHPEALLKVDQKSPGGGKFPGHVRSLEQIDEERNEQLKHFGGSSTFDVIAKLRSVSAAS